MVIFKLIGVGIIGTVLSLIVKQHKPEIAIAVPILTTAVIVSMCVPYLTAVIAMFEDIASLAGIEISHMQTVIKITGIAYICQFAADLCRDAGETAIASKVELAGKVAIVALSVPIIYNLLSLVSNIINF